METYDLLRHLGLATQVDDFIDNDGLYDEELTIHVETLLKHVDNSNFSYAQKIQVCYLCIKTNGIAYSSSWIKKLFVNTIYTAALALQENINPPNILRIKNKANLKTYLPAIKNLETYTAQKVFSESDLRSLIRLAMIARYNSEKLIATFNREYPDQKFDQSEFNLKQSN